jgi:putative transposase
MTISERLQQSPELRDTTAWPRPDDEVVPESDRREYFRRCQAIKAYLTGSTPAQVFELHRIPKSELYRMLRRCLSAKTNGELVGFYALIPGYTVATYARKRKPDPGRAPTSGGLAGAFGQLMSEEEGLRVYVQKAAIRLNAQTPESIARAILKGFLSRCAKVRSPNEYPFNARLRSRALAEYIRRFLTTHFASEERVTEASANSAHVMTAQPSMSSYLRPYEEVEHDGHEGDFYFVIKTRGLKGEWVYTTPMRLWLLLLIDRASRAILGYSYRLGSTNYPAFAVMRSFVHALKKWEPKELTIAHLQYKQGGGFPSGVCPLGEGRLFDMVCFDNALANRAELVSKSLTRHLGATVNIGRANHPISRPFVERLNQTLEKLGFRRLPIGFDPKGSKDDRTKALAAASDHAMTIEELEQVIDVMLANYNADPHSALVNRSPIEYIKMSDETNISPIRRTADPSALIASLTRMEVIVSIRGGGSSGKTPYVQFAYAQYANDVLAKMTAWQDLKMRVVLDYEGDVRFARGFVKTGGREVDIGILRAGPPWHLTPHTLEQRRLIERESRIKKIVVPPGSDMVQAFHALKLKEAAIRKAAVNQIVKVGRIQRPISTPQPTRDATIRVPAKDWIKLKP